MREVGSYRIYELSPIAARQPSAPSADTYLGRYGQNIASVLRRLEQARPEQLGELLQHLQAAVPTVERITTDYLETKQLGLFFHEKGFSQRWFANDVSDGTLQATASFLALLSGDAGILLEEPETSLHPWILQHLMELANAVSTEGAKERRSQVILTTHSPVAVTSAGLDSLFVVERRDTRSIVRPATEAIRDVTSFQELLSSEALSLGETWVRALLGGVPE